MNLFTILSHVSAPLKNKGARTDDGGMDGMAWEERMSEPTIEDRLALEGNPVFTRLRLERDALKAEVAALRAELEQARREADVRIALDPGPHVHSFQWSTADTATVSAPPPGATCACGITYAEASEVAALRARVEELERMGNELVTFMGKDASPTSAWKEFVELLTPPPPRASGPEGEGRTR